MKLLFILVLMLLLLVHISEAENYTFENSTLLVEPRVTFLCGEVQDKIFRIERTPYDSSMKPLDISYTMSCANKTSNISKSFKKYTEAKTGSCTFLQSGNYTLTYAHKDIFFSWPLQVTCQEEEPTCFNSASLHTNTYLFSDEEQLTIDFDLYPEPDALNIDYWIEDLKGDELKKKRTTTNIDTKKHTFKGVKGTQAYLVKAIIEDDCQQVEREKLIVVQGEEEEAIKEEELETSITIEEIKQDDTQHITVVGRVIKGNERGSVVELNIYDTDENKVSKTEKIKVSTKNSEFTFTTQLFLQKRVEEIKIVLSGLGEETEKYFLLEQKPSLEISNTYTRQTHYTTNITWYVRIHGEGTATLVVNNHNASIRKKIELSGSQTISVSLPYSGGDIHTKLVQEDQIVEDVSSPVLTKKITQQVAIQQQADLTKKSIQKTPNISLYLPEESLQKQVVPPKKLAIYSSLGLVLGGAAYALFKEDRP